jgi:hypothetical protein
MTNGTMLPSDNRPYPPPSNVIALLQRLRRRNLPERIDAEYLRASGITDSLNARTLFALRFLRLVEGDSPTQALRSIAKSSDEEYQEILQGLIREAYHDVFEFIDPTEDSQDRIVKVFQRYDPASQRQRMVVFFLGMCREAGIPTLDAPRNRASSASTKAKVTRPKTSRSASPASGRAVQEQSAQRQQADQKSSGPSDLHPLLEGLVRSLPAAGAFFPTEKRDQWLQMMSNAMAYVYVENQQDGEEDDA